MLRCPYFMFVVHIFPLFFLKTILDVIGLGWPLWTNTTCYGSPSVAPLSIGCPCPHWVCLVFLFIYLFYFYMWHSLFHWWIIRVASWDLLGPFGVGVATWLDLSIWRSCCFVPWENGHVASSDWSMSLQCPTVGASTCVSVLGFPKSVRSMPWPKVDHGKM